MSSLRKPRLRDLGIEIGEYPPGEWNAITDVPGVLVGQVSLIHDEPNVARTGATVIFPRAEIHRDHAFAAFHSFNGIGEMTGLPFLEETALLTAPILLTNTNQVGLAHETLARFGSRQYGGFVFKLPVVAETYDGWLNEIHAYPLQEAHFLEAIERAAGGPVAEGNTGGGTGMICYGFKGGTGSASRQVEVLNQTYTVGALVQANHGERRHLLVGGQPVGRRIGFERVPSAWAAPADPAASTNAAASADTQVTAGPESSSIIVLLATDAPLLPHQCRRLAQRATVGLARTGGFGLATSGDLFLAFSTGIHFAPGLGTPPPGELFRLEVLPEFSTDPLVIAAAEAVEEAILNALVAAETLTGYQGHTAHALPHDLLVEAYKAG